MCLAAHSWLQKKPLVEPTSASNAHPQRTQVIRQQMPRDRSPAHPCQPGSRQLSWNRDCIQLEGRHQIPRQPSNLITAQGREEPR
jgi:hypothetical protein